MFLKDLAPAVGFGTSGVRALVSDLTAPVVATYVRVFIQHLRQTGQLQADTTHCVIGWDLRPSSPDIAAAVCAGLLAEGLQERIMSLIEKSEIMVLASHDFGALQSICERGLVFHHGEIVFDGNMADSIAEYKKINNLS